MTRKIIIILIVVFLVAAFFIANHYAPFQGESYAVYLGIGVFMAGILSAIRPFRFIGLKGRGTGLIIATAGLLIFMTGMMWPAPMMRSDKPHQNIDDFMPEYQFYEYHEVTVNAPAEKVARAIGDVSFSDIPAAMWLMRIRAMASGPFVDHEVDCTTPVIDLLSQPGNGFLSLDTSDNEYVCGMTGRPWSNDPPPTLTTPAEFMAFQSPGNIKVTFNMHVFDMGNGTSRLTTETRIIGNDDSARRVFACYWRIIYPGSAIIRRVWLDAIAGLAARG